METVEPKGRKGETVKATSGGVDVKGRLEGGGERKLDMKKGVGV